MPERGILINLSASSLLRLLFKSMEGVKLTGRFQLLAPSLGLNEVQVVRDLPRVMEKI